VAALKAEMRGSLSWEFLARATIIDNQAVMERLAPVVRSCKGNTDAMAAAITPVLRSLVASGAVPFPAEPATIAAAALLLAARPLSSRRQGGEQGKQWPGR
jgi:hypothetical protein